MTHQRIMDYSLQLFKTDVVATLPFHPDLENKGPYGLVSVSVLT